MGFNIIYIDDEIDIGLSEFLEDGLPDVLSHKEGFDPREYHYGEVVYDPSWGLQGLMGQDKVLDANVVIVDSRLFDAAATEDDLLTGEEVCILMRRMLPFVEVIIITQVSERMVDGLDIYPKYDHSSLGYENARDYYTQILAEPIWEAIRRVEKYRLLYKRLKRQTVGDVAIEKIRNSLRGIGEFDELSKEDIDNVVMRFEEIKRLIVNA